MSDLVVRMVTDCNEFESLRKIWDELLQKSNDNNIYLTWEWLFTWWKHYGEDKRLSILLIEDEGRIIGIVPLMQSVYRKGFIKFDVLENISSTDVDYGGVILTERKEESVAAIMSYLEKMMNSNNIILRMTQIPENSEFLTLVQKLYPQFSKSLILDYRILTTCPYIPLPTTWEEYFGSFSSKTQKTLRRMLKSLGKEHEVEFEKFSGDGLERHVRETFELKQKRWQKLHLSGGIASDQKAMAFYIDVAKSFSEKGWLHLSFLKVDGDAVSAVYGFTYNQKFYWCIPGFDPDYSKYGVGTLLTMYLIEDAIKMGLKEFDFLVGEESHKLRWHTLSRSNIQVVLLKRSLLNKLQLKLLYAIFRLDVICKRSLLENYRLYLIMRKEKRRRRERKRRHISEI